jgi:hypothetical protein
MEWEEKQANDPASRRQQHWMLLRARRMQMAPTLFFSGGPGMA